MPGRMAAVGAPIACGRWGAHHAQIVSFARDVGQLPLLARGQRDGEGRRGWVGPVCSATGGGSSRKERSGPAFGSRDTLRLATSSAIAGSRPVLTPLRQGARPPSGLRSPAPAHTRLVPRHLTNSAAVTKVVTEPKRGRDTTAADD